MIGAIFFFLFWAFGEVLNWLTGKQRKRKDRLKTLSNKYPYLTHSMTSKKKGSK